LLAEYGITVNGVAPAEVATEFIGYNDGDTLARRYAKTGRISLPEEVASVAVYLASFMGKQMPGKIIEIDGGDDTIKLF
jgi:NAD(P)-dependent dehydrogenase (short-subunit alcohol dehydrogenase family)